MEKIYFTETKNKNQNNNNKTNNHVHVTIFTWLNWWKNSRKHKLIRDEFLEDDRYIDFFGPYSCQILHIYPPIFSFVNWRDDYYIFFVLSAQYAHEIGSIPKLLQLSI